MGSLPTGRTGRKGFTLIELLTVMALIAILAAILFPVFARTKEKGRQTSCLSNVKQLALAALMYTEDWNDCFPVQDDGLLPNPKLQWPDQLMPYVENPEIYRCPSEDRNPQGLHYVFNGARWIMVNTSALAAGPLVGMLTKTVTIRKPAKCALIWDDGRMESTIDVGTRRCGLYYDLTDTPPVNAGRHNEGDNFGFADGHAKWFDMRPLKEGLPQATYYFIWPSDATPEDALFWTAPFYPDFFPFDGGDLPIYY